MTEKKKVKNPSLKLASELTKAEVSLGEENETLASSRRFKRRIFAEQRAAS